MNEADMDSEPGSEKEDANEIESEKLDASHREIIEKLKRQEMEERQEIERELEEAQREASIQATHDRIRVQENDLGKEDNRDSASSHGSDSEQQLEIKMQRPLGLLASHGLTTKSHSSHSIYEKEREKEREKAEREKTEREKTVDQENDMIVPSPTTKDEDRETDEWAQEQNIGLDYSRTGPSFSERAFMPSPPLSSPQQNSNDLLGASPGHHWTFEEQFKQVSTTLFDLTAFLFNVNCYFSSLLSMMNIYLQIQNFCSTIKVKSVFYFHIFSDLIFPYNLEITF